MTPKYLACFAVALLALTACGNDSSGNRTALELNRLASGDLEYCPEDGQCATLPYAGDCARIHIEIDTVTGDTCERCVRPDGSVTDESCSNTTIACVVVEIPDPDCVVCAYVNGAVLFSSCNPAEPQCVSDADCFGDDGRPGRCTGGSCEYEPECRSNQDCPAGWQCEYGDIPPAVLFEGEPAFAGDGGVCVPPPQGCNADSECPPGDRCEPSVCPAAPCTPDACPPCEGQCVPDTPDPCALVDCGPDSHCEPVYACPEPWDGTDCEVYGECVPDEQTCTSDAECPGGYACEIWACPGCVPGEPCPPCFGSCIPYEPNPCDTVLCEAGFHCEVEYNCEDSFAGSGWCEPEPVCVQDASACMATSECGPGEVCNLLCPPCPPGADCECVGYCEDACALIDCAPGYRCEPIPSGAECVPEPEGCVVTGCSGQICASEQIASTCEWRPEYACYDDAECTVQANGMCGWTQTSELQSCLEGEL